MSIADILMDYPKGAKLYSPLCGEVELIRIDEMAANPIILRADTNSIFSIQLTENGHFESEKEGECLIFPSKDNRNWDTAHKRANYEQVLVRAYEDECWMPAFLHHKIDDDLYKTIEGRYYSHCIPYKGNESLVGTTNKPLRIGECKREPLSIAGRSLGHNFGSTKRHQQQ